MQQRLIKQIEKSMQSGGLEHADSDHAIAIIDVFCKHLDDNKFYTEGSMFPEYMRQHNDAIDTVLAIIRVAEVLKYQEHASRESEEKA